MEVSSSISREMLVRLQEPLAVSSDQVYPIGGLLDLADLGQLYASTAPS